MSKLCLYGHIKNDWKGYTMDLNKIKVYRGNPLMMGATVIGDTVNFAITARLANVNLFYMKKEKTMKRHVFLLKMRRL